MMILTVSAQKPGSSGRRLTAISACMICARRSKLVERVVEILDHAQPLTAGYVGAVDHARCKHPA
jgi:hypothetical protein